MGLYTPFNHEVAFVPLDCWSALQSSQFNLVPPQILNDLVSRKFVVGPEFDDTVLKSYLTEPYKGVFSLFLIVAQECNMGCSYCVVESEDDSGNAGQAKDLMSPEVGSAAVRVFAESLEKHKTPISKVTIYGGEPLLNKEVLFTVIPQIRAIQHSGQQQPVEILSFTNGLTYDDSVAELYKKYRVSVGVSVDGKKRHHDAARRSIGGGDTFDKTIESYRRYIAAGLPVGISCTIGKHNVNDLPEIADYFINELKATSVQFQPPIQMPHGKNSYYVKMKDAAANAFEAFKKFRAAGIEEGLALRRLTRFSQGQFHYRDCGAVGGGLAVSADGSVGPCHNATYGGKQYFSGNVLDPTLNIDSLPSMAEWHARIPINMSSCQSCSSIALCGGGCPYNALIAKGSIWEKDPQICEYMIEVINLILEDVWERYSNSQSLNSSHAQGYAAAQV